jgi:methionyl-tRNA synthetase
MSRHILTAVAWPYANGPRHIGHVAGFGVPSDVFSRYHRLAGNDVLMVSGTDEHGTPILVQADHEGVSPRELADRYNRVIAEDLQQLGLSYDLFTRTTTRNHYTVVQEMFTTLHRNGYLIEKTTKGAISPSTGRTLPDRYIEGTCPICGYDGARGDQCDNCGNQLDAEQLINPHSRINGETPVFVETEHFFLDLPALADALGSWLQTRTDWRPNVLKFSLNLLDDLRPRAMSRDIDWGVPIPLPGWEDNPNKRLYVWFDAVIGYLSASVEWARRTGDPDAWRAWWTDPSAESYYFMGKDNVTFHAQIWPAELLGYDGKGAKGGAPGRFGELQLPSEVVSSEFLTMEGQKFSSSRNVVIYVRDFLSRYSADSLRYYLSAAGPETADTDFTWSEFVRRNNDELVAAWGNLVNRSLSFTAKNIGAIPAPAELLDVDRGLLDATERAFGTVGARGSRPRSVRPCGSSPRPTNTSPSRRRGSYGKATPTACARSCTSRFRPSATATRCSHRSCRTRLSRCTRCSAVRECSRRRPSCATSPTSTAAPAIPSSPATTRPTPGGGARRSSPARRSTPRRRCSPSSTRAWSTRSWPGWQPSDRARRSRGRRAPTS